MPITILPNGHNLFATIEEGLPDYQQCPHCEMWFTQMSEQYDVEEHIHRCTIRKAEEARKMIAAGYRSTSKGWAKAIGPPTIDHGNETPRIYLP